MHDHPTLPPWLTPTQFRVLARVITVLETTGIPYVATGGLAGNLHGSTWPLHDIDLDVPGEALALLATAFAESVRVAPGPYRDEEFELDFLGLSIDGVEIDVTAAESVILRAANGARRAWPTDLTRSVVRTVGVLSIRVLPLDDLLAYKRIIGRSADVQDLERLR